jgi:hypothetical protein
MHYIERYIYYDDRIIEIAGRPVLERGQNCPCPPPKRY